MSFALKSLALVAGLTALAGLTVSGLLTVVLLAAALLLPAAAPLLFVVLGLLAPRQAPTA
jgi:hypothetical protein